MKQLPIYFLSFFVCLFLFFAGHVSPALAATTTHGLHVQGNHFVDANGNIIVLRGASRWSLEFSCGDGHFNPADFQAMRSWGMNIVRLPLNENYLLFPNLCGGTKYLDTIKTAVKNATAAGMYVLLDLHWTNPYNNTDRGGQNPMPESKSTQFWKTLATIYKNDDMVLYEPMNEPHDIDCTTWKKGGSVTPKGGGWINQGSGTYTAVGFQTLADTIHSIAPSAVIIQGASGEADATCSQTNPLTGNNIAYQSHFYGTDPTGWATKFLSLTNKVPVIAGEFDTRQGIKVVNVFEKLKTGYLGWAWEGCTGMTSNCNGAPPAGWTAIHDVMLSASKVTITPAFNCLGSCPTVTIAPSPAGTNPLTTVPSETQTIPPSSINPCSTTQQAATTHHHLRSNAGLIIQLLDLLRQILFLLSQFLGGSTPQPAPIPAPTPSVSPSDTPCPSPVLSVIAIPSPTLSHPQPTVSSLPQQPQSMKTPPMGWNHYNAFGNSVNENLIKSIADTVVSNGMKNAGYQYINIDDSWQGARDAQGNITANGNYPSGIKALADYVHAKGLKFGIYTTPANTSCGGKTGSGGHFVQDVKTFASWGVDFIKLDWCGADYSAAGAANIVKQWQDAIKASGRPMMLSINAGGNSSVGGWAKNYLPIMWRSGDDICASWFNKTQSHNNAAKDCFNTNYHNGMYDYLTSNIQDNIPNVASGHYADPDMMEVGNPGLTFDEAKTHFSMWAMWAAPLLAGNDVRNMNNGGYDASQILLNKEVIAIDQDPAVVMAKKVQDTGGLQVWDKKLQATNTHAVALVNTTNNPATITFTSNSIGFTAFSAIRDLWTHQDLPAMKNSFSATVPPHGIVLIKVVGQ